MGIQMTIKMVFYMIQMNLAPAHWTEHWGHFDHFASTWMKDMDSKVGDRMGRLLGVVPRFHNELNPPPVELISIVSETDFKTGSAPVKLTSRFSSLNLTLQKERSVKKRLQRRLLAVQLRAKQVEEELAQCKVRTSLEAADPIWHGALTLLDRVPHAFFPAAAAAMFVLFFALSVLRCKGKKPERSDLQRQLYDKSSELLKKIAAASIVDEEVDSDTVQADDVDTCDSLDADFSFCIFDKQTVQERMRFIKIKCPGVQQGDVVIDVVGNGCVVTINRKPSQGVDAAEWVRRFVFPASDGFFDLRDDQLTLDGGFLTLSFRAVRSRVFRFPERFDMSVDDYDSSAWLQSDEVQADRAESTILQAAQALRVAAATESCAVWSRKASTVSSAASSLCGTSDDFDKLPDTCVER
jgi:hypothetical protein